MLAAYGHHAWQNPAIIRTWCGSATHIATMVPPELLSGTAPRRSRCGGAGLGAGPLGEGERDVANAAGAEITFLLNYAKDPVAITAPATGRDVLTDAPSRWVRPSPSKVGARSSPRADPGT